MVSLETLARSYSHTADRGQALALAAFDPCEVRCALLSVMVWSYDRFIDHVCDAPEGRPHLDAHEALMQYEPQLDKMGRRHLEYAVLHGRCDLVDAWSVTCPQLPWAYLVEDPRFASLLPALLARVCSGPRETYEVLRHYRSPLLVPYVNQKVAELASHDRVVVSWMRSYGLTWQGVWRSLQWEKAMSRAPFLGERA